MNAFNGMKRVFPSICLNLRKTALRLSLKIMTGNEQRVGAQDRNIAGKGSGSGSDGVTLEKMLTMFSCGLVSCSPGALLVSSCWSEAGDQTNLLSWVGRRGSFWSLTWHWSTNAWHCSLASSWSWGADCWGQKIPALRQWSPLCHSVVPMASSSTRWAPTSKFASRTSIIHVAFRTPCSSSQPQSYDKDTTQSLCQSW